MTKPLTYRSYSQVRQLRTCGEQYRLERIERVPSRPSCAAVAGKAVHAGTETVDHLIVDGVTDHDSLFTVAADAADTACQAFIDEEVEHGWEPSSWKRYGRATIEKPKGEDITWFRSVGIPNAIQSYVDWRLETPDFVLAEVPGFGPAIEVPFNYYVDGLLIHGWIDRVFTSAEKGGYYPVDIKSGQKPKTDEQLGLYGRALSTLGWDVTWGYYLYGMKTGTAKLTPPLNIAHWTDQKLGDIYLPATRLIDLGVFMPTPGDACFHCGVSDSCAFAQAVI